MILSDSGGGDFINAPEGLHDAVCVDVIDLGMVDTQYGPKPKLRIVWEIAAKMDDGQPFTVRKQYNASLGVNNAGVPSTLRADLKAWRGADFTIEELKKGWDPEVLIGKSLQILVQHEDGTGKNAGKKFANAKALMKAKMKLEPSGKYIRVKDRKPSDNKPVANNGKPASTAEPVMEIPF